MGILVPGRPGPRHDRVGVLAGTWQAEERQGAGGIPGDPAQRGGDARSRSTADGRGAGRLGTANGFTVDVTQDPERIQDATLKGYRVVVFLSSTGEPLDPTQQAALERWVEAGGGWVGVHAAADAFYDWPWYGELVGAWFRRHPSVQRATVHVTNRSHPSTGSLPAAWTRTDEWYDFRDNPGRM
jgi:Trehalose utilisation